MQQHHRSVDVVGFRDRSWISSARETVSTLASGAKREVFIRLYPGKPFTRDAVEATKDRDIRIDVLANDHLVGGMTYRLDPDLSRPWNADRPKNKGCLTEAQRLAECLGIKQDIGAVCVEKVVLSLKVRRDDCCD